jgi:NSS family neurotransmitter:Na+ symporter
MSKSPSAKRASLHGLWTSRITFILAATGATLGLGNIWKFPYETAQNGGGIFVALYFLCLLLIGIPIMIVQMMLGRRGRRNPAQTMRILAHEEGLSANWGAVGRMAILAGFLILSYYSVVGGWVMAYVFRMAGNVFEHADAGQIRDIFTNLILDPEKLIAWHTIFMIVTVAIVARGVRFGLEASAKYMIPAVFFILLVLLGYVAITPAFIQSLTLMFMPDINKLTGDSVLSAMAMAFFSLSLGMGALMMYSAYLPRGTAIVKTAVIVAVIDAVVSIVAGVVVFSLVLANGLEPAQGTELIFTAIPLAFSQMPAGALVGALFFLLLTLLALASAVALLEMPVAWLIEEKNMERPQAARLCGVVAWVLGLGTVFSFNLWTDYKWTFPVDLGKVQYVLFKEKTFFDIVDFLASNLILPLFALLIVWFAGHLLRREIFKEELALRESQFNIWYFVLRNISPIAIAVVLLHAIGVFS